MPAFVLSLGALERNARVLREVADAAGCHIALALKGFACWKTFPTIAAHLDGCCASGLWEAMLARDHFGPEKQVITYSPAYTGDELSRLCDFSHHLDFNSLPQWLRFRALVTAHSRFRSADLLCGLRINPEHSTGKTPLYDPCSPGSRLGATAAQLDAADLAGISGLHFHTLCEQDSDDLESTLAAVDEHFGELLRSPAIRYLNMGGGHWITKPDYDRARLVRLVRETRRNYDLDVWLEPGEAAAIHTGVLRASVLDVFESAGHRHAILDVSATAHMPDVLEMPYRPDLFLVEPNRKSQTPNSNPLSPAVTFADETYHPATDPLDCEIHNPQSAIRIPQSPFPHRLGGPTCLAGDIIGDYAFPRPLITGDTLVFDDMAHYTMVKTSTFNGVPHPDIVLQHPDGSLETIRKFAYPDYRDRLA